MIVVHSLFGAQFWHVNFLVLNDLINWLDCWCWGLCNSNGAFKILSIQALFIATSNKTVKGHLFAFWEKAQYVMSLYRFFQYSRYIRIAVDMNPIRCDLRADSLLWPVAESIASTMVAWAHFGMNLCSKWIILLAREWICNLYKLWFLEMNVQASKRVSSLCQAYQSLKSGNCVSIPTTSTLIRVPLFRFILDNDAMRDCSKNFENLVVSAFLMVERKKLICIL